MTPYYADDHLTLYGGDCRAVLAEMPAESVHTVVTSPPYWGLRDYGTATWDGGDASCDHVAQRKPPTVGSSSTLGFPSGGGQRRIAEGNTYHEAYTAQFRDRCGKCGATRIDRQLGLEPTPEAYVANMVAVFREVRRVLRADGTLWLNLGDSYATSNPVGRRDADRPFGRDEEQDGSFTLNVRRDTGLKPKDLVGIPWRVAFALQADGWYLRSDIIWAKPNPMPESVTDRPTKAHEYLFLLSKAPRYYYDADAVREALLSGPSDLRKMVEGRERIGGLVKDLDDPLLRASGRTNIGRKRSVGNKQAAATALDHRRAGTHAAADRAESGAQGGRNLRSVWTIATEPYPGAHFATFPRKLVEPCVKAGSPEGGTVLDPFAGSGTTLLVAQALGRRGVGIDLNPDYLKQALARNAQAPLGLVG